MGNNQSTKITVQAVVHQPIDKVWAVWTEPQHITKWNQASDDWHAPYAENDLRAGGKFLTRMEAKDGSFGFDFSGTYDEVRHHELITYTLDDNRQVTTTFTDRVEETYIVVTFDAEQENPAELQQAGWQAILDSFKRYAESV